MTQPHPKDTIISIVKENFFLRWAVIALSLAMVVSIAGAYLAYRKPSSVWVVTEDGKITNDKGHIFEWEAKAAAERAVELYYEANSDREQMLSYYMTPKYIESSNARTYLPVDKFIRYRVIKVERTSEGIRAEGILMRRDRDDEKLSVTLVKTERNSVNPYGLVISDALEIKEKQVIERPKEGMLKSNTTEQLTEGTEAGGK